MAVELIFSDLTSLFPSLKIIQVVMPRLAICDVKMNQFKYV